MEILKLIEERHSVRQYISKPIEKEKRDVIDSFIKEINEESSAKFSVFYDEPKCFSSILAHYGRFENVTNYICVVGKKKDQVEAGYLGERLVLKCQELGLNTCWVALTHGKTEAVIEKGNKLLIVIALGYGKTNGFAHKSKDLGSLSKADEKCGWFELGVKAASLAPTAINQQKFFFELKGGVVTLKDLGGPYSKIDLGIVKCHFELASGHKVS